MGMVQKDDTVKIKFDRSDHDPGIVRTNMPERRREVRHNPQPGIRIRIHTARIPDRRILIRTRDFRCLNLPAPLRLERAVDTICMGDYNCALYVAGNLTSGDDPSAEDTTLAIIISNSRE
jgi:hypothetical protein